MKRIPEQRALMLYYWMLGKSASEVAGEVLGDPDRRNTVISFIHRAHGHAADAARFAHMNNKHHDMSNKHHDYDYEVIWFRHAAMKRRSDVAAIGREQGARTNG